MDPTWPCPCCGYLTLEEGPGDYAWCGECSWEDDGGQLAFPLSADGANGISLVEGQSRYEEYGLVAPIERIESIRDRAIPTSRTVTREPGWRPIDLEVDLVPEGVTPIRPLPIDRERLYWWRPTYYLLPDAPPSDLNDDENGRS